MNPSSSKSRIPWNRPGFRIACIVFLIALGAFCLEIVYVPPPILVFEGVMIFSLVVLAFLISFYDERGAGSLPKQGAKSEDSRELNSLLAGMIDPLLVYDSEFRVTLFNQPAEQLFRLPATSVVGHVLSPRDIGMPGWQVLTQTVFSSLAPRIVPQSREGDPSQVFDLSFSDPDLELRVITILIPDELGNPRMFLKILRDRTAEIAALRSKSEFLTVASHQFRGPATDISWALQTLQSDATLSASNKEIVATAFEASRGLIQRIEDLLSVAKMEEGQSKYQFEDTDIVDFVGKILAQVLPAARKASIKMYFDRPAEAMPHVMIDSRELSIVIVNLLENAIRYNVQDGEVIARVDVVPGKPFVRVSVKDTGIGIPPDALDKLFKKFFRAPNAVASQTEGSGLGLYISKGIVNAHGGEVMAESELGRGTVISFTLPTDPSLLPTHRAGTEGFLSSGI